MTREEIGRRMAEMRKSAGFTTTQLSEETGINKSSINQMELGKQNISLSNLIKLADAINAEVIVKSLSE